jgi:tRNA (adenine22-N1)-methyltransferase
MRNEYNMKKIHLSPRLLAVLRLIPPGSRLADIGSDHAHLPIRALQEGLADRAIAGEVRIGPYRQSRANVETCGLAGRIDVRLGDGLSVLRPGEADCIVMAGMGGELIAQILQRGGNVLASGPRLILQPNSREPLVRRWLMKNSWRICDEAIVAEGYHYYELITAELSTQRQILSETQQLMGPLLLHRRPAAFLEKWHRRAAKLEVVLHTLNAAGETAAVRRKREDCARRLHLIRLTINE